MTLIATSKRFRFVETRTFTLPSNDESQWRADAPGTPPLLVEDKWVYVFQVLSNQGDSAPPPGTAATLVRACYVEANDVMRVLSAAQARVDTDLANGSSVPAASALSLPDKLDRDQFFYYFFASRIQLGTAAISRLEQSISNFLPAINLPDVGVDDRAEDFSLVPVVDPMTVATFFHVAYIFAANAVIRSVALVNDPTTPQTPKERSDVRTRTGQRLLANAVKSILDFDTKDDLKVGDANKTAVLAEIARFTANEKDTSDALIAHREEAARALTLWLDGSLWSVTELSYRERENATYDQYVNMLASVTRGLGESSVGKVYFAEFAQHNPFAFEEYVARHTPVPVEKWDAVSKCAASAVSLFGDLIPFLTANLTVQAIGILVKSAINSLASKSEEPPTHLVVDADFGPATIPVHTSEGVSTRTVEMTGLVIDDEAARKRPEFLEWEWEKAEGPVLTLGFVLQVANFGINIRKFNPSEYQGKKWETFLAGLNTVGGAASAAAAFALMAGEKLEHSPFVRVLGRVGAAIEVFGGVADMISAVDESAWGRFAGDIFLVAGSVFSFLSMCAFVLEAGRGGVYAFIGAILAVIGAVIVSWFKNGPLCDFVIHCSFGPKHLDDNATPSWSPTSMSTWTTDPDGLNRQIVALYNLVAAFDVWPTLALGLSTAIRVTLSDLSPRSRVSVEYWAYYERAGSYLELNPRLRVDPFTGTIEEHVQDAADVRCFHSTDDSNRRYFDIAVDWPNGLPPAPPGTSPGPAGLQGCVAAVWLDLMGDASVMIPTQPLKFVSYVFPAITDNSFSSAT